MKNVMAVVCLTLLAAPTPGQELPKVTEEGKKAAEELVLASLKTGALKIATNPRTMAKQIVIADDTKLKEIIRQRSAQFTPAIRNGLLVYDEDPGIAALLVQMGQATSDDQAVAFGQFFSARLLAQGLNYSEAKHGYEQAALRFERLGMNSWLATTLNNLAEVCYDQGDLLQARRYHQQALDLRRNFYGERHAAVAISLSNLGSVCLAQGDLTEARKLAQAALELRRQLHGERHSTVALCLNNLAEVYRVQGDLDRARKLYQQALGVATEVYGERHVMVAHCLNNLAVVCHSQGDLAQARTWYYQALSRFKDIHGERHPAAVTLYHNLAEVYRDQGDLNKARQLHQRALDLAKKVHGERHPAVASALASVAVVSRQLGDLAEARRLHEQALDQRRQFLGERHPAVASSLNNLGGVCLAEGNLPQARDFYQQALDLRQQLFGERHPDVAATFGNLAVVCRQQGDLPQVVEYARQAVLACRLPGVEREHLADLREDDFACDSGSVACLQDLGLSLQAAAKTDERTALRRAASTYALAAGLLDRLRGDLQTEEGKLFQGDRYAAMVRARVGLAASLFDRDGKAEDLRVAFTAMEQGRARVFLEALARARSSQIGGVPEARLEEERDLLGQIRTLEARIQRENNKVRGQRNPSAVGKLYGELQQKRARLDEFAARLRRDYPQYAALQYPKPCSLDEARTCLGDSEVAVLFAVDRQESYAVVVQKKPAPGDRGEGVAVVALPGTDVLGPMVRTLVDTDVLKFDSRCRDLGAQLFNLLLKPLTPHIQGKDLVLVPDGMLWELPFEMLVEGRTADGDGHYLIEGRQIRYAPSMTVLHINRQWEDRRRPPPEALWALADPVFSKDDLRARGDMHQETRQLLERYASRGTGKDSTWRRLPATRAEARTIAELHRAGKDDVVLDVSACERVVKTASERGILARKRYLHLATHGILGAGLGRQPSLVLSLVGNDGAEQLGGANDGFLTLAEVTHLKLNADLVVLSACETGKGDLRPAEGVTGLARAFLYAGSRGVVCSLWSVDDERTATLMKALYGQLKEGKPAAEALALARRQLITAEQAPFYWAPFILIGR